MIVNKEYDPEVHSNTYFSSEKSLVIEPLETGSPSLEVRRSVVYSGVPSEGNRRGDVTGNRDGRTPFVVRDNRGSLQLGWRFWRILIGKFRTTVSPDDSQAKESHTQPGQQNIRIEPHN